MPTKIAEKIAIKQAKKGQKTLCFGQNTGCFKRKRITFLGLFHGYYIRSIKTNIVLPLTIAPRSPRV